MALSGRYLLGDSPAEIRHLVEQAETYAPEASELLGRIDMDPGTAAIDIGCGVLGILHLLAERVGPQGRVVGLDREARMVDTGRQFAEQRRLRAFHESPFWDRVDIALQFEPTGQRPPVPAPPTHCPRFAGSDWLRPRAASAGENSTIAADDARLGRLRHRLRRGVATRVCTSI